MGVPICEYIQTGGRRCGSPALTGQRFCYYHTGQYQAMPMTTMFVEENPNVPKGEIPVSGFQVPFLDDAAAIQIGFMQLIHGVAHFRLEPRRAKLILSALHGAAANLRKMDAALAKCEAAKESDKDEAAAAKKRPASVKAGTETQERTG